MYIESRVQCVYIYIDENVSYPSVKLSLIHDGAEHVLYTSIIRT